MSKKHRYYGLILVFGAAVFYLFPLFFNFDLLIVGLLTFVNAVYCVVFPLLYTVQFGVSASLPIVLGSLFIPAVFWHYSAPMLLYAIVYAGAGLVGCCLGYPLYRKNNSL